MFVVLIVSWLVRHRQMSCALGLRKESEEVGWLGWVLVPTIAHGAKGMISSVVTVASSLQRSGQVMDDACGVDAETITKCTLDKKSH